MTKPHNQPSDVVADAGEVIVEGPDGVSFSLTPEAATRTSARLLQEAVRAKGQIKALANEDKTATRH